MRRDAAQLLIANLARYTGQLVIFLILARIEGPETAGHFALALAVTAPVFVLAGIGMRSVYLTLHMPIPFRSYETLRASLAAAAVILSTAIAILARLEPELIVMIAAVALSKSVDLYGDLYMGALQKASRSTDAALTSCVAAVIQVASFSVALVYGGPTLALLASALGYALVVWQYTRRLVARSLSPAEKAAPESISRPWKHIFRAGLPTGVSFSLIALVAVLPQYYLGWQVGPSAVAKFVALMYLLIPAEMILNSLSQTWIPTARELLGKGLLDRRALLMSSARWLSLTAPASVLALVAGIVLFPFVFGPEFAIQPIDLIPLSLCALILPVVFSAATALAVENRYDFALFGSFIALTVAGGAGWFLVMIFGLSGGLWAYALGLFTRALFALLASRRHGESTDD